MTRLIDADKLNIYDVSPAYGTCVMGVTEEDIELAPTVNAIPVNYIQDRIDSLQELAEYELEANGGYTGQVHTEVYALRRLINQWKGEQDG